tara:strand:- start:1579 stop:2784 length:1206 start_codon:yes stop_codon:yes gene_type:complete
MKKTLDLVFAITVLSLFFSCRKVNDDCNVSAYENAPNYSWIQSHSGSGEEAHGHFILTCNDGGFLQIGETGSNPKIIVVKTNESGNLLWKKEFSEGSHNLGNSIIETDNEYVICGSLNKNSCIIKLNKLDGSTIQSKTYENGGADAIENITEFPGGYAAVGYNYAEDENNTFYTQGNAFLMLLDENLNQTSFINLNNYMSQAYRIKKHMQSLLISGLTDGASDYALVKTDFNGNIIWNKTYGGNQDDHCFGMDLGSNGNVFLTGHTLSGTENWDTYTIKIDSNGNSIWELKKGNPRGFDPKYIHDETWGIKATNDGGCIIVAGTGDEYGSYKRRCGKNGDNSNEWRVYLIKINASGSLEWEKTYGGPGVDWAGEDIDLTSDGGAIVAVDDATLGFLKIDPF